ncbi:radical SAM protein [Azonexus sp.]|uniref:radical SAM protein n=1 Tax=Azonexus sp. TaxID=1872668 RepID=UPI0039E5F617
MLRIDDHNRFAAGFTYVYPVLSRRAGGVSVGINLNPNNACNWACLYCQVDNLQRGGPPPIDLAQLIKELASLLDALLAGAFVVAGGQAAALADIAFSGNGESTAAAEFAPAVQAVCALMQERKLEVPLRLITNGSFLHRPGVQEGLRHIAAQGGEVWFKFDRGSSDEIATVNAIAWPLERAVAHLAQCAALAPTWVQTCWFCLDGAPPSAESLAAYCAALQPLAAKLQGVHLYGLARPSQQAAAPRLSALSAEALEAVAAVIRKETGLKVIVSP